VLSERAAWWATEQVGRRRRTVAAVARELGGAAWRTVMRAVRRHGQPLVDDPARLTGVDRLGVDEHALLRATARHATQFATGIIDTTGGRPARPLDVVPGRTGSAPSRWLTRQEPAFREQITVASPDPFRGYATALTRCLPAAIRVVDGFHITRLGGQTLTEVRCRVQQQTLGHRGRTGDPLYGIRRVLLRRADRLSARARSRLEDGLLRGDPEGEVWAAWLIYQHLLAVYAAPDAATGRTRLSRVIDEAISCPAPELARLGRTLRDWRTDIAAYFNTNRTSNRPTETVNLVIKTTHRAAHGFRNFANNRLRLLLSHGVSWHDPPQLRIRTRSPRLST
jgi:transposase